ncbi:MAG TPA: protease complex subunit PrcB family protein [Pyrinomonadaceae bacterium]|nr:protease complex subunit PrcB family protein [Pyrinomonadaceae bacterium]
MKTFKLLSSVLISFTLIGCASAQTKKPRTPEKPQTKTAKIIDKTVSSKPIDKPMSDDIKILTEGAYSKIEQPFVFVARSNETYTQLQNLVENLPPVLEIDFSNTAVVAAFAGEKNTGGFSVSIKSSAGRVSIETINPPKDAMVTQVITTPFKVALVPLEENNYINLELSASWKNTVQTYRITSGTFEYSGGLAGTRKEFGVEGTIGVLSFGDNATLVFNLAGKGVEKTRKLSEATSGLIKDGKIDLARLDAGSFSENPKPSLKVSGTTANNKLLLVFESIPSRIADGFQARGKIEAVKAK